jgi:hypothetical protein
MQLDYPEIRGLNSGMRLHGRKLPFSTRFCSVIIVMKLKKGLDKMTFVSAPIIVIVIMLFILICDIIGDFSLIYFQ